MTATRRWRRTSPRSSSPRPGRRRNRSWRSTARGAYQVYVHATGRCCFGLKPADIGWIVGHSYIVYAPLLSGCTTIAYEGALDHPGPETAWRIIQELRVTGIFTSPTAVRLLMRYGEAPARAFDLSSLERIVCAGEVLNA